MRAVFMGTPDFSVAALSALIAAGHELAAVVTQPDRPKGRGKALCFSPVKELALREGIPVLQPVRARDESFIAAISELAPDVCVVAAYGQILPAGLLAVPKYGCVNIHASLLPKYRGAAPIQWAVINGDEKSGVTTMQMDAGMDTGDIWEQAVYTLSKKETGGSLYDRLSCLGGDLIVSTLKIIESGTKRPVPQNPEEATYVRKIEKSMGEIDFSKSAETIERLVRGLDPWPSAFTHWGTKLVKIWGADVISGSSEEAAGTVLKAEGGELLVQTGCGILKITDLQLEGKKRLDAAAFLRGCSLKKGEKLGK